MSETSALPADRAVSRPHRNISIEVPTELWDRIQVIARREHRSVRAQASLMLMTALREAGLLPE
jgi:hypothetical protein